MPFIAITEKAFAAWSTSSTTSSSAGSPSTRGSSGWCSRSGGLDEVAREIAAAVGGSSLVLDALGERRRRTAAAGCRRRRSRRSAPRSAASGSAAAPFVPSLDETARPCARSPGLARGRAAEAWLVVVRALRRVGRLRATLILQQAAVVVALELMRRRVERETERRLAGEVLTAALSAGSPRTTSATGWPPSGSQARPRCLSSSSPIPAAAEATLAEQLASRPCRAWSRRTRPAGESCSVRSSTPATSTRSRSPRWRARRSRPPMATTRAAASRAAPTERVRHSFHEARCALEATGSPTARAPEVASWRDLGAFTLLLSVQDDEALRLYCDSVLGPIEDPANATAASCCARWRPSSSKTASGSAPRGELYCHRHTLRYRIAQVEELTGRDLTAPTTGSRSGWRCGPGAARREGGAVLGAGGTIAPAIVRDLAESEEADAPAARHRRRARPSRWRASTAGRRRRRGRRRPRRPRRKLDGADVLVNSACYRINLAAMGPASRRAATTSTWGASTT